MTKFTLYKLLEMTVQASRAHEPRESMYLDAIRAGKVEKSENEEDLS
jgi:hypothetical protein